MSLKRYSKFMIWSLLLAALAVVGWMLHGAKEVHDGPRSSASDTRWESPWTYGSLPARITVTVFADLECPYCKAYVPTLRRWIDANPEVSLQWHHLPLAAHEPAASREAVLAECVGRTIGPSGFWIAIEWIYAHSRGSGQGLPDDLDYPGMTPALQACLDDPAVHRAVQTQATDALQSRITATPTLRLRDQQTGRELMLAGPIAGDALLSAIDLLTAQGEEAAESIDSP